MLRHRQLWDGSKDTLISNATWALYAASMVARSLRWRHLLTHAIQYGEETIAGVWCRFCEAVYWVQTKKALVRCCKGAPPAVRSASAMAAPMMSPVVSAAVHVSSKSTTSTPIVGGRGRPGCSPKKAASSRMLSRYSARSSPATLAECLRSVSGATQPHVQLRSPRIEVTCQPTCMLTWL